MNHAKALGWSLVVALNVLAALALLLWLILGPLGLFLVLCTWPAVGGAAFILAWICRPSPGLERKG